MLQSDHFTFNLTEFTEKSNKHWGAFGKNALELFHYATRNKKQHLLLIFPANPCLIACCLHDPKGNIKAEQQRGIEREKCWWNEGGLPGHPSLLYHLLIFLLTAPATVLFMFLTFFPPHLFQATMDVSLAGPSFVLSATGLCCTKWQAGRVWGWTANPCRGFPASIGSSRGLILHATAISQLGSSLWFSSFAFSAVLTKCTMRMQW